MKTRVVKLLLVFSLVLSVFGLGARNIAAENTDEEKALLKQLLLYYTQYRNEAGYVSDYSSEADYDIDRILNDLKDVNPYMADAWKDALDYWDDALYPFNGDYNVNSGILPDGLPNDESLAIVCLGYALNKTTGQLAQVSECHHCRYRRRYGTAIRPSGTYRRRRNEEMADRQWCAGRKDHL